MRRLAVFVTIFVALPSVAVATELDELLERGREASYSGEQWISCSTPDGVRDALVHIEQSEGLIRISPVAGAESQVATGAGGWTLLREGGVVTEVRVDGGPKLAASPYVVEDLGAETYLGRNATAFNLIRDGVLRAELVFDDETGALVYATTFDATGDTYCIRRFVTLDEPAPALTLESQSVDAGLEPVAGTSLPETVAGFTRLDQYEDQDGFRFAYYSDGFFSFAVFETPSKVSLPDGLSVEMGGAGYQRSFSAGQATYVWETRDGGMALVGDVPPDLHAPILTSLPPPSDPGFFRRIWRSLFG